jgi:hypothetical protein
MTYYCNIILKGIKVLSFNILDLVALMVYRPNLVLTYYLFLSRTQLTAFKMDKNDRGPNLPSALYIIEDVLIKLITKN